MTTTRTVGRRPGWRPLILWDTIVTSILLGLLGVLTFFISVFGAFLAMASDPCGALDCDNSLIGAGVLVAMAVPWVLFLSAVVISIILVVLRKIAFWVPLVTTPLVVASWFAGAAITGMGVPSG